MVKEKKWKGFRILLWKRYFDTGFGLLNYLKYLVFLVGLDRVLNNALNTTILLLVGYALVCFFLGWFFINWGYWETEQEIINRFNPFVKEMRKLTGIPNNRKV